MKGNVRGLFICDRLRATVNTPHYIAPKVRIADDNEHIRTWKDTATVQLEVLSHLLPGEAEASARNLGGDNQIAGRDLNPGFSENKADTQNIINSDDPLKFIVIFYLHRTTRRRPWQKSANMTNSSAKSQVKHEQHALLLC